MELSCKDTWRKKALKNIGKSSKRRHTLFMSTSDSRGKDEVIVYGREWEIDKRKEERGMRQVTSRGSTEEYKIKKETGKVKLSSIIWKVGSVYMYNIFSSFSPGLSPSVPTPGAFNSIPVDDVWLDRVTAWYRLLPSISHLSSHIEGTTTLVRIIPTQTQFSPPPLSPPPPSSFHTPFPHDFLYTNFPSLEFIIFICRLLTCGSHSSIIQLNEKDLN